MAAKIFVNLPVKNLKRSIGFFAGLGYEFDPRFTDENAACLILGENHYAMLITEKSFATFTPKAIVDAERNTEVLVAVSAESREAVNAIADKALGLGARKVRAPEDYGFMYGRSFQDPDGHIWEHFWMDPAHHAREGRYGKLEVAPRGDREIVLTRPFDAARGALYAALTNPELIRQWLSGPPGWAMTVCRVDLRTGGSYRYEWRNENDGATMASGGTIRELAPGQGFTVTERFDQPWYTGESVLTFALAEEGGTTTLTMTVQYESQEVRDGVLKSPMMAGMASSFNQLGMLLAG